MWRNRNKQKMTQQLASVERNPLLDFSLLIAERREQQLLCCRVGVNEQATEIGDEVNPFNFWDKHADELSDLYRVAKQVLIVPATSAPVERLFSHGGIVTRPHRASIGDKTLSNIIFLKCNRLR